MVVRLSPETGLYTKLVQQDSSNALAGDVDIEQLSLIYHAPKGLTVEKYINNPSKYYTKDIVPRVQQIDLYYSIFTPTIYCELQCADAIDDLHNEIEGEEYLYLEYKSPIYTVGDSIRLLFRVYKISDVLAAPNNRLRTYKVFATSPEAIDNATYTVYRSLRTRAGEQGTSISDIVPVILSSDLKTTKTIDIEQTTGIVNKYLANLYPLQAVDYLRQVATTTTRKTGSYVFFEKPTGYVFRTLEDLFDRGQKQGPVASFIYDTIRQTDHGVDDYVRPLAYNEMSFIDNYSKIVAGGFGNEVNNLDLITGKYTTTKYDHGRSRTSATYADPTDRARHNTDQFIQSYTSDTYSKYIVSAATDGITDGINNLAEKLAHQQAYALELAQNITQIAVHGNSKITIGDVINLSVTSPTSATGIGDRVEEVSIVKKTSGNYLISRCRDIIKISARPSHLQSLELIKGQFLIERST